LANYLVHVRYFSHLILLHKLLNLLLLVFVNLLCLVIFIFNLLLLVWLSLTVIIQEVETKQGIRKFTLFFFLGLLVFDVDLDLFLFLNFLWDFLIFNGICVEFLSQS